VPPPAEYRPKPVQLYDERTGRWRAGRERDPEMTPREGRAWLLEWLEEIVLVGGTVFALAWLLKSCG
jgi:hypothetical protein